MLLSRRYQFLFVHIAKTGGTSVRNALQRYRWRDPYYLPQWIASKMSGITGHSLGIKLPRHCKAITAQERRSSASLGDTSLCRAPSTPAVVGLASRGKHCPISVAQRIAVLIGITTMQTPAIW